MLQVPRNRPLILVLAIGIALGLYTPSLVQAAPANPNCTQSNLQNLADSLPYPVTISGATTRLVTGTTITFCDVTGKITTTDPGPNTVLFELGLPLTGNNHFLFIGGGGFNGYIPAGVVQSGVAAGFATAYTDSGHESVFAQTEFPGLSALDGSWALSEPGNIPNLAAQTDFSYRAVHVTTVVGQQLTQSYYDLSSSPLSYFDGCSTGGREAMVEAQKFPDDYNGIIAGDPAIGDPIAGFNWNDQALLASSQSYLTPAAVQILDSAVTNACDLSDGVKDGLIQDPERCHFNVRRLQCRGNKTSNCLTAAQIGTIQAIVAGAHTEDGEQIYPGYTLSNPGGSDGWIEWITGATQPLFNVAEPWGPPPASLATAPLQWSFQDQFLKYFVFNDPNYDSLTFNINSNDLDLLTSVVTRNAGNGVNTNLQPFFAHGGKLIMYHGWADPALTPLVSVDYYNAVAQRTDGGLFGLRNNARLFMVPGMHHCGGGPGPNLFNALPDLTAWVEHGQAPDQIIATHCVNNNTASCVPDRTMPLCPYPQLAHYIGGDVNQASSWICGFGGLFRTHGRGDLAMR